MDIRKKLKEIKDGFTRNSRQDLHIKNGNISRFALKAGDIFLEYDNQKHQGIRFAQKILNPTYIKYSNFVHGGIILSNTELIHADGSDDLQTEQINDLLDHKEYRIFRAKNEDLVKKIAEVTNNLKDSKAIQYPHYQRNLLKFNESKTNASLFTFSRKAKHVKELQELEDDMLKMVDKADYENMLYTAEMAEYKDKLYNKIEQEEYKDKLKGATKDQRDDIQTEIQDRVNEEAKVYALNKLFLGKKKFFCTQLVAWVVQMAVGQLKLQGKISFRITDVLNVRDTKATPARLADILKHSPHFIEYKSLERYIKPEDR